MSALVAAPAAVAAPTAPAALAAPAAATGPTPTASPAPTPPDRSPDRPSGWPPAGWPPAGPGHAGAGPVGEAARSPAGPDRTLGPRALLLVAVAIGIGALGMALSWALSRDSGMEPDTYIRYAIVITLGVYALVGGLVVTQITPSVRLRWRVGDPLTGVATGVAVGGGVSAALLALVSVAAGHLAPDPRVVVMMSEGDPAHILTAALIGCVCAPLVEEVLFRGLLLESLRRRGTPVAVIGSGLAFAIWHLNPAALRYYALLGAMLGVLYVKRGLLASLAAHAAFNGVLTVAAIAVVLAPTKTVTAGDVSIAEPGGWSRVTDNVAVLALRGPSGSWLGVLEIPMAVVPDADQVAGRIGSGRVASAYPGLQVDATSTREVSLPAGTAVEVDVTANGHRGTMVLVPGTGHMVEVMFVSGGSARASRDFAGIVRSLRVS